MKPEVKLMLVNALVSGDYKQSFDKLRERAGGDYTYCVMGVLINLYCIEHNIPFSQAVHNDYHYRQEVEEWAGFERDYQHFLNINGVTTWPHYHNDHHKVSFQVLAKAIKEQY